MHSIYTLKLCTIERPATGGAPQPFGRGSGQNRASVKQIPHLFPQAIEPFEVWQINPTPSVRKTMHSPYSSFFRSKRDSIGLTPRQVLKPGFRFGSRVFYWADLSILSADLCAVGVFMHFWREGRLPTDEWHEFNGSCPNRSAECIVYIH